MGDDNPKGKLPEHQLLARSDQPFELERDDNRLKRATQWAIRRFGEQLLVLEAMAERGELTDGQMDACWTELATGVMERTTRTDLVMFLLIHGVQDSALDYSDRLARAHERELDRLISSLN